jgi:CheY-like chemotaxis protein
VSSGFRLPDQVGDVEILLVEDNPNDAELAVHALTRNFISNRIELVRDGAEALDFLFRRGEFAHRAGEPMPRLILLDNKLPKVSGLEVLQQIKRDDRTRSIPVVMLTSSREQQDVIEGYDLGLNGYVVKPFDFKQFTESVATLGLYWLVLNSPPVDGRAARGAAAKD